MFFKSGICLLILCIQGPCLLPALSVWPDSERVAPVEPFEVARQIAATYGASSQQVEAFLLAALDLEKEQGLPAAAIIGIALLESGGFTSYLFVNSNNPFGIKATKPWDGPAFNMFHEGKTTPFRFYEQPDEAVRDFAALLRSRRWFADALECDRNINCFLEGLCASGKEPGYSRDPKWRAKILNLIDRFQLDVMSRQER